MGNRSSKKKNIPQERPAAEQKPPETHKAPVPTTRNVFVIGGPGSGKGTQCEKAAKQFSFSHFSTGDLLRAEIASNSERGQHVTEIMTKGDLVPLEMVLTLLQEAIQKAGSTSKGSLIDGYPRTVEQGTRFESAVAPVDCVIYFHVSDETMKQRLLKRAETSGRTDDTEEVIKHRIATFHSETQPVIDHYTKENKVHTIEAEGGVDEIFEKVAAVLSKK